MKARNNGFAFSNEQYIYLARLLETTYTRFYTFQRVPDSKQIFRLFYPKENNI